MNLRGPLGSQREPYNDNDRSANPPCRFPGSQTAAAAWVANVGMQNQAEADKEQADKADKADKEHRAQEVQNIQQELLQNQHNQELLTQRLDYFVSQQTAVKIMAQQEAVLSQAPEENRALPLLHPAAELVITKPSVRAPALPKALPKAGAKGGSSRGSMAEPSIGSGSGAAAAAAAAAGGASRFSPKEFMDLINIVGSEFAPPGNRSNL